MQFNSNSDFPASHLPPEQWHTVARPPPDFEPAPFIPCACLTARVLIRLSGDNDSNNNNNVTAINHPSIDDPLQQDPLVTVSVNGQQYSVVIAKGVLVQTMQGEGSVAVAGGPSNNNYNSTNSNQQQRAQHDSISASSSDSSDDESSSDDDIMMDRDANYTNNTFAGQQMQHPHRHHHNNYNKRIERAYWLRGTLRQAIYGHVRYGIILHKLDPPIRVMLASSNEWTSVEWEATNEAVAVKEMSWENIRYQRSRLVEDPIKEAAAMQYLKRWVEGQQEQVAHASSSPLINGIKSATSLPIPPQAMVLPPTNNVYTTSPYLIPQTIAESHIMIPLDLFTDHRNMYSIMPYCSGGELFDVLESKNRFTELEARYWMRQILRGLACLKKAGVAHRDLSLENLLIHDGNVLVIDMGMCLRVPRADDNGQTPQQHHHQQRCLILPQGVCGKWGYMSPEVCNNKLPFDGHAVDLWAAGVILFLMLTGFPPWERPVLSDERFKYMSNGYLVQMLTEWKVGLSADAMDLLQRMFWLDPLDRLSLEQVWSHPWMQVQ